MASNIIFVLTLTSLLFQVKADFGLLYTENVLNHFQNRTFCISYNPLFQHLEEHRKDSATERLRDLTPSFGCDEDWPDQANVTGYVAVVKRGNCTFSEKAFNAQAAGAQALIVVSEEKMPSFTANQTSDYNEINITVALITSSDYKYIQTLGPENVTVQMYAPAFHRLDYNLILIWLIAMVTIVSGSYWSGTVKFEEWKRKQNICNTNQNQRSTGQADTDGDQKEKEKETLDVSPKYIVIFVVLMCGMLVALFFFYDYLVYAIIGIFCLAASMGLYACLVVVVKRIPFVGCRIPRNNLPLLKYRPEIRRIILALFCIGISVWWAIERHSSYAWILQNILGFAFSLNMLKTIRVPNLLGCVIMLGLLFVYDIFFVFITPLFTKDGDSVMVDVATGGKSSTGETLPMVFKVPHILFNSDLNLCDLPFSLLGYGDVLVPGFLVSYVHAFDLIVGSRGRVYFVTTSIAYGIGLVITFVALFLMESGQPALLYLVPCTLLTVVVTALCRGELRSLWKGKVVVTECLPTLPPETEEPTAPAEKNMNVNCSTTHAIGGSTSSVDSNAHEQDALIQH